MTHYAVVTQLFPISVHRSNTECLSCDTESWLAVLTQRDALSGLLVEMCRDAYAVTHESACSQVATGVAELRRSPLRFAET